MIPPVLYRGDSIPESIRALTDPSHRGRTLAEHYYREGLMAKSGDGGLSTDLSRPLAYLVAAHIGCDKGTPEERVSAHSPLISFSTKIESAGYYSNPTQKKMLEVCAIEKATHFVWKLTLPDLLPTNLAGVFRFDYKASTQNVDRFRNAQVNRVMQGDESSIISALVTQAVHSHLAADGSTHSALVIEPQTFLASLRDAQVDKALVTRALLLAKKWTEWLIYPNDPMEDGRGYSARFTLNQHLNLHSWARQN